MDMQSYNSVPLRHYDYHIYIKIVNSNCFSFAFTYYFIYVCMLLTIVVKTLILDRYIFNSEIESLQLMKCFTNSYSNLIAYSMQENSGNTSSDVKLLAVKVGCVRARLGGVHNS